MALGYYGISGRNFGIQFENEGAKRVPKLPCWEPTTLWDALGSRKAPPVQGCRRGRFANYLPLN
jgi:hypothetical protein